MTLQTQRSRLGYMPTPQQELLLKAALFRDERARTAWQSWKSRVDLVRDYIDGGTFRLLPLLYLNLRALRLEDEHTQRLKGIYRKSWYENQMQLHVLAQVAQMFDQAGILTLALKGVPLSLLHYKDMGARPMSDTDVLVPTECAKQAIDLCHANGWREKVYEQVSHVTPAMLAVRHSWCFENEAGREMDLHWHALYMGCFPGADDEFWRDARALIVNGMQTSTLNATDLLLHVLVHGGSWNYLPPIRWVSDACTVLSTSQDALDWDRLVRMAEKFHVILHLRDTLGYVKSVFGAHVPAEVNGALARANVSSNDCRVYLHFSTQTNNLVRKAERHFHNYHRYRHLWHEHANAQPPVGIINYMKVSLSMSSVRDVLPRIAKRMRQNAE